jgi:hypothetical protein
VQKPGCRADYNLMCQWHDVQLFFAKKIGIGVLQINFTNTLIPISDEVKGITITLLNTHQGINLGKPLH